MFLPKNHKADPADPNHKNISAINNYNDKTNQVVYDNPKIFCGFS